MAEQQKRGSHETQRGDSTGQHDRDSQAGGTYFTDKQAGCALEWRPSRGDAASAAPRIERTADARHGTSLGRLGVRTVTGPCTCWRFRAPREIRIKDTIAHIFDYHIMKKKDWTLDRLADWVETVEPKNNDPRRIIDPELQTASESRPEEDWLAANEWQERVAAFTATRSSVHGSRHK
jgi:hypothetical protein